MWSLFYVLLWFVVSCSSVCRTFTPTANKGSHLAGQSWLAAAFKLMNCLFTITTITTHEENVLFCVTRIRVWLICRSSEILFHFVSKWIKICELKIFPVLFIIEPSCGHLTCECDVFITIFRYLWTPWTLHKWECSILLVFSGALDLTLMISIWRWWLDVGQC